MFRFLVAYFHELIAGLAVYAPIFRHNVLSFNSLQYSHGRRHCVRQRQARSRSQTDDRREADHVQRSCSKAQIGQRWIAAQEEICPENGQTLPTELTARRFCKTLSCRFGGFHLSPQSQASRNKQYQVIQSVQVQVHWFSSAPTVMLPMFCGVGWSESER